MSFENQEKGKFVKRTGEEWIADLGGANGADAQWSAHEDLARYLYRIAVNDLKKRQEDIPMLRDLSAYGLGEHAQDFVQSVLEKLARDDFAILDQYTGAGSFTGWVAQVMHRQVSTELRKARWHRTDFLEKLSFGSWRESDALSPEALLLQTELRERIQEGISKLPERYITAFVRCEVEGESAVTVAESLGVTANAVYILIHRARSRLRTELAADGYAL